MKYRTRIQLLILGSTALIYIGSMSFFLNQYMSKAQKEAYRYIDISAKQCAKDVEAGLNLDIGTTRSLATSFSSIIENQETCNHQVVTSALNEVISDAPNYRQVWVSIDSTNLSYDDDSTGVNYITASQVNANVINTYVRKDSLLESYLYADNIKEVMQDPYWANCLGQEDDSIFVSTFSVPIRVRNQVVGAIGVEQVLKQYQALSAQAKPFESSRAYLISNEGFVISAGTSTGSNVFESEFFSKHDVEYHIRNGINKSFEVYSKRSKRYTYYSLVTINVGNTRAPWAILVKTSKDDVMQDVERLKWIVILIGFIGLILMYFIVRLIAKSIINHIEEFTQFSNEINTGNLVAKVDVSRKDEIGVLAKSLRGMANSIRNMAKGLHKNGDEVSATANYLNKSSQDLSSLSNRQAAAVEEVASAMEEMAANISANTDNARKTEDIALLAKEELSQTVQVVRQSHTGIEQIVEKISVISDIAFQTNILALNAAVEASRAGDAGRGFAVVASEVRKLAEKSREAADSITGSANEMLDSSNEIRNRVEKLLPNIERTEEYVREIATAGSEQNNGAAQINTSLQEINESTQHNAAAASEYSNTAHKLTQQAEELKQIIQKFKL